MREIFFEPGSADCFLGRLRPLWGQPDYVPHLVGDNDLAIKLREAAVQDGVTLQHGNIGLAGGVPLIILTETSGERLHQLLMAYVELTEAYVVAPVTDWHFSKKPLFLVSIPKAGTHLLYELAAALGYAPGIHAPEFPLGQSWYCLEYENSHTGAPDFFVDSVRRSLFGNRHHSFSVSPVLFIYRHPLDILVAESHYYHGDGKTIFSGWLSGLDFSGRVERLLADNGLLGSFADRIKQFVPWLDFPNVIKLSFEELVGSPGGGSECDQLDVIWSILLKLQAPGNPREICKTLFNRHSATFRSGQIGGYKQELSVATISTFAEKSDDIFSAFGYSSDGDSTLPARRMSFRRQILSYSKSDFDKTPITIEAPFLGCNLVRYGGRIYAVPVAAGEIHLERLPVEKLALLPSAENLQAVKLLLVLGKRKTSQRLDAFHQLGAVLREQAPADGIYCYWQDVAWPVLVEEYNAFNIVLFGGRFYGIRQSLGMVDLTENLQEALRSYAVDDFVVGSCLERVRDEIDQLPAAFRIRRQFVEALAQQERAYFQETQAVRGELEANVDALKDVVTGLRIELGEILVACDALVQKGLDSQWRDLRRHEEMISTILSGWPFRLARFLKRCMGREA